MGDVDSYFANYLVQTVLHSVVVLVIVESSLRIWEVEHAQHRFRYRLLTLLCPLLLFPAFQIWNPARGGVYFIEDDAFFASVRWLQSDVWGLPIWGAFILVIVATTLTTFLQELRPLARSLRRDRLKSEELSAADPRIQLQVNELSAQMGISAPPTFLLSEELPLLLVNGTRQPSILVSRGALRQFDGAQLKSALAHELAHIMRRSTATTVGVFLARLLMFYNPVSLLTFRRLIQDDEQVCDDLTIAATGDPDALASALEVFQSEALPNRQFSYRQLKESVASHSHNLLLKERILRLREGPNRPGRDNQVGLWLTFLAAVFVCYRVV